MKQIPPILIDTYHGTLRFCLVISNSWVWKFKIDKSAISQFRTSYAEYTYIKIEIGSGTHFGANFWFAGTFKKIGLNRYRSVVSVRYYNVQSKYRSSHSKYWQQNSFQSVKRNYTTQRCISVLFWPSEPLYFNLPRVVFIF